MNVWVVMSRQDTEYEEWCFEGIFSTIEKAKDFIIELHRDRFGNFLIDDQVKEKPIRSYSRFYVDGQEEYELFSATVN